MEFGPEPIKLGMISSKSVSAPGQAIKGGKSISPASASQQSIPAWSLNIIVNSVSSPISN